MACYVLYDEKRRQKGFICGKLGAHCADCGSVGDNLCDFPVGNGKTCDRSICDFHSHLVGPNMHYCDGHFAEFESFKNGEAA